MATLTIRLPDDKYAWLKDLAISRGISINKFVEELSTFALTEFDAFNQFKTMAAIGYPQDGLANLDQLDALNG